MTEKDRKSFKIVLKQNKTNLRSETLRIFGNFYYIPQIFLDNLHF